MELISFLRSRGLIDNTSCDSLFLDEYLEKNKPVAVYCGFDPSSDSLHLGNFLPIRMLKWFHSFGHKPIALVGGATGMIGDPSGKNKERSLLNKNTLEANTKAITEQLRSLLGDIEIVNNADWYGSMSCVDFLRDVGKHFRLGTMLAKDSVRTRLNSEEGISFTEFSYQVLQGYDFELLNRAKGVKIQICGSDQWGNITAGIEHAKKTADVELFGLTFPLLLKSDGTKFGKSEQGALWLSEEKLSSYDLYQSLVRVPDADVIKLLFMLTDIDSEIIDALKEDMQTSVYVSYTAQKMLAESLVRFIRGEEGLKKALLATVAARPGDATSMLTKEDILALRGQVPEAALSKKDVVEKRLDEVLVNAHFSESKADVRRLIKNGGLVINGRKVEDEFDIVREDDLIENTWLLVSFGKKKRLLIRLSL
jgi:tyrosyl-tRNA synthetase